MVKIYGRDVQGNSLIAGQALRVSFKGSQEICAHKYWFLHFQFRHGFWLSGLKWWLQSVECGFGSHYG
ncbi:hypothetical protein Plhal304r1_c024g0083851 [Plasmopara halstedii]